MCSSFCLESNVVLLLNFFLFKFMLKTDGEAQSECSVESQELRTTSYVSFRQRADSVRVEPHRKDSHMKGRPNGEIVAYRRMCGQHSTAQLSSAQPEASDGKSGLMNDMIIALEFGQYDA